METMTKLSNLFGLSKNKGPITTVQKVKLVKKDLNSHMLPKSDKITILNTIKKAEIALDKGMEGSAKTLLSQATRDIKKAVKKKKRLSYHGFT
jgi:hypothetical protein